MQKTKTDRLPPFFYDNTQGDPTKEALLDFFLSWTLRCARKKYEDIDPLVYEYSRKILIALLQSSIKDGLNSLTEFIDVRTWKQWAQTDLTLEAETTDGKLYALLIENKIYTKLHDNQLQRYKNDFEKFYEDKKGYQRGYIYITSHDNIPEDDAIECKKKDINFTTWTLKNLRKVIDKDMEQALTGNDLFDEFWKWMWEPD